jgi:hypothetical protein
MRDGLVVGLTITGVYGDFPCNTDYTKIIPQYLSIRF